MRYSVVCINKNEYWWTTPTRPITHAAAQDSSVNPVRAYMHMHIWLGLILAHYDLHVWIVPLLYASTLWLHKRYGTVFWHAIFSPLIIYSVLYLVASTRNGSFSVMAPMTSERNASGLINAKQRKK